MVRRVKRGQACLPAGRGFYVKISRMQTFKALSQQLKLTQEQETAIEAYCSEMVVELLESIKQDNVANFDETINSINLKSTS